MLKLSKLQKKKTTSDYISFDSNYAEMSDSVVLPKGSVIQTKFRMIHGSYSYSTGGSSRSYYAFMDCFKTTIVAKSDYSGFLVSFNLNGEPTNHNIALSPVRTFNKNAPFQTISLSDPTSNYDIYIASHQGGMNRFDLYNKWNLPIAGGGWGADEQKVYYNYAYTNPGNYDETDYNSTPIQTCDIKFFDYPNVKKGTEITYCLVFQSNGNNTFYVNRCVDANLNATRERGVSMCHIQEIKGPVEITTIEPGLYEYRA